MSHRALAVVTVIGLVAAGVTFVQFQRTYFWALLSTPAAGAYGTSWADLPPPEIRAEGRARADALYAQAAWTQRVSYACAALSLAGIIVRRGEIAGTSGPGTGSRSWVSVCSSQPPRWDI